MAREKLESTIYETEDIASEKAKQPAAAPELDIFAFLPDSVQKIADEVVTIDAPPGYNNADGTRAKMQLRRLSAQKVMDIREQHLKRRVVKNAKGRAIVGENGRPVFDENVDTEAMQRDLIVESLVFPDVKSEEMREKYLPLGCTRPEHILAKLFPTQASYVYISDKVTELLQDDVSDEETLEQAKN